MNSSQIIKAQKAKIAELEAVIRYQDAMMHGMSHVSTEREDLPTIPLHKRLAVPPTTGVGASTLNKPVDTQEDRRGTLRVQRVALTKLSVLLQKMYPDIAKTG